MTLAAVHTPKAEAAPAAVEEVAAGRVEGASVAEARSEGEKPGKGTKKRSSASRDSSSDWGIRGVGTAQRSTTRGSWRSTGSPMRWGCGGARPARLRWEPPKSRAAGRPRQADDVHESVRRRGGPALPEARRRPGGSGVLHDDLDLPVGAVRLKRGGGTGGHNGLRSLKERLGTADFLRIRVGIGRPPAGVDPADYVLTPPAPEFRGAFDAAVAAAAEAFADIVRLGSTRHDALEREGARGYQKWQAPTGIPGGKHTPCSRRIVRGLDQPKGGKIAR